MRRDIFFGFRWYESASRIGIKKARDAITFHLEGIRKPNQKMHAPLQVPSTKDGTKQGLATFIPLIEKFLIFRDRYKELLLSICYVRRLCRII